jgi:nicotinamide mononucleotide (NMN) deamidase PncC
MHLARLVSGERASPRAADALRKATSDYALAAVGLTGPSRTPALQDALASAGFQRVFEDAAYELWARSGRVQSIQSK